MFKSKVKSIAMIGLLSLSWSTLASTLTVANNLDVKEINSKMYSQGFFATQKTIDIPPGENTIVIRYNDVFEDADLGQDRLIVSEYFVVKFTQNKEENLLLKTPKINGLNKAELFSQSPEIMLLDEQSTPLPITLEQFDDYQLARQVEKVLTTLPLSHSNSTDDGKSHLANAANDETNTESAVRAASEETSDINQAEVAKAFSDKLRGQVDSLPMLKYWWQQASTEDKQHFLKFIKSQ